MSLEPHVTRLSASIYSFLLELSIVEGAPDLGWRERSKSYNSVLLGHTRLLGHFWHSRPRPEPALLARTQYNKEDKRNQGDQIFDEDNHHRQNDEWVVLSKAITDWCGEVGDDVDDKPDRAEKGNNDGGVVKG